MAVSNRIPPADVPPVLLHEWQMQMLENIWHFNQVTGNDAPLNEPCPVYVQPDRDMIAGAMYQAYSRVVDKLNFHPVPVYLSHRIRLGDGIPFGLQSLRLPFGQLLAIGIKTYAVIEAAATVTYSDPDGSGVNELATITVTSADASVDEVQAFFQAADGAPDTADPRWQIAPLKVTKSGNTITITGHRALFVKPSTIWNIPYTGVNQVTRNEAVTTDATDFVTEVDVYRVYPDATGAVTLETDPAYVRCTDLDTTYTSAGQAWIEDAELGLVRVRFDEAVCRRVRPEYVYIRYQSGLPFQYTEGYMDTELSEAIVHLANTLMPQKPCEICNQANASWQEDRNMYIDNVANQRVMISMKESPFGVRIGAQKAWQIVRDRRKPRGRKLTR